MPHSKPLITYDIALDPLSPHSLTVKLAIPEPENDGQILSLPAWIPGSYMIRDFAKNITEFAAYDTSGAPLGYQKLDKQTWKLNQTSGPLVVEYKVYAFDLSIRSAYICDEYAFFNGTSVFLKVQGQEHSPCQMTLLPPKGKQWRVATAMETAAPTEQYGFGEYLAKNYDELIDHPVLLGEFDLVTFKQDDVDFELVLAGGHNADTMRMTKDLQAICHHHISLFDDTPPVERYVFLTLLTHDGFGGLEHRSSTALLYSRDDLPNINSSEMTEGYRTFLSLCSHELFHTWHVKRIQPQALKTATLETETYTEQLWIYEGFTSYYDDLSLVRSGVVDEQSYLELAGQNLTRLLRNQGRFKQSVTDSSFYAWTKFYQQDASAINNIVSYYNKGAVIAMCLDLHIRQQSGFQKSLDDVMRQLWQGYGKPQIGTHDNVIHTIVREFGLDLEAFLNHALYSTEDLAVAQLLKEFGVKEVRRQRVDHKDKGGKPSENTAKMAFGANFKSMSTGVKITQVSQGTPAHAAGLQVGDQLISLDHKQVSVENLQKRLDLSPEQGSITLHLLRDHKLKSLEMEKQVAPQDTVFLEIEDSQKLKKWFVKP